MKRKILMLFFILVLIVGSVIGGTMAWLYDSTDDVKNTFTTSNIDITLTEDAGGNNKDKKFKMVPGYTIKKDPKVTVHANSEKCYLFIKVVEDGGCTIDGTTYDFDDFLSYEMVTDEEVENTVWTKLTGIDNVWYIVVNSSDADQSFSILNRGSATFNDVSYTWNDNEVLVNPTVTKEMMNALTKDTNSTSTNPTLTFIAYASQFYKNNNETNNSFTAAEAWNIVSGS